MSIYKRKLPSGAEVFYFRLTIKFPDGTVIPYRQKAGESKTRKEAETYEREFYKARMAEFQAGTLGREPMPTFEGFTERFLEIADKENKASWSTQKAAEWRRVILPYFGSKRLDVTSDDIDDFAKAVAATTTRYGRAPTPSTINKYLRILSRALHLAHERTLIPSVPKIRLIRPGKVRPITDDEYLTFEEADALLANAGPLRALVLVALRTGLRIGELLALRWDAVSFTTGRLHVKLRVYRGKLDEPKGNRSREVPMDADVQAALKAQRAETALKGPYVFGGAELPAYGPAVRALRAIPGRPPKVTGWHILRHTFAAHCFMTGVKPLTVQRWMGHSSLNVTTEIYGHLDPRVEAEEIGLLVKRPAMSGEAHGTDE